MIEEPRASLEPKPVRKHRRTRPLAENGDVDGEVGIAALVEQNKALLARVDALERGGLRTVEATPEPQADVRLASPLYDSPFLAKLLEQTRPVPNGFGGDVEPDYNVPARYYLKPDSEIVLLQGD